MSERVSSTQHPVPDSSPEFLDRLGRWICSREDGMLLETSLMRPNQPARSIFACGASLWISGKTLESLEAELHAVSPTTQGFGGWIGSVTYEGAYDFARFDQIAIFDHHLATWVQAPLDEWVRSAKVWENRERNFEVGPVLCPDRERFLENVRQTREYIAAGDIYQANLSHRFQAQFKGDPSALYRALRAASPAPHAGFLRLPGRILLSASPECFLRMEGREVFTRPIKGTRARAKKTGDDLALAQALQASPKEQAEIVMITDLLRNDLGKICEYGEVRVDALAQLESFAQVHHLVSTISGRLREEVSHAAALASCFPGGSITGAPKHRAMEIIRELESGPRGDYTGCFGVFGDNEESVFAITIRTIRIEDSTLEFRTGAGVVADSEPELEFEETMQKARGILKACRRDADLRD